MTTLGRGVKKSITVPAVAAKALAQGNQRRHGLSISECCADVSKIQVPPPAKYRNHFMTTEPDEEATPHYEDCRAYANEDAPCDCAAIESAEAEEEAGRRADLRKERGY